MLHITATHLLWPRAHRRPRSGHQDGGRESCQPLQHLVPQLGSAPVPLLLLCPVIELHASATTSHALGSCSLWGFDTPTESRSILSLASAGSHQPVQPTPPTHPPCHRPLPTHSASAQSNRLNQKPAHTLGIPQWLCMTFSKNRKKTLAQHKAAVETACWQGLRPVPRRRTVSGWRGHALGPRGTQVTGAGRGQRKAGERLLCAGARPVPGNPRLSRKGHVRRHFLSRPLKLAPLRQSNVFPSSSLIVFDCGSSSLSI